MFAVADRYCSTFCYKRYHQVEDCWEKKQESRNNVAAVSFTIRIETPGERKRHRSSRSEAGRSSYRDFMATAASARSKSLKRNWADELSITESQKVAVIHGIWDRPLKTS
ncbi:hypothetical protein RRG08_007245 [Elysia crispata]|uniref:Uncharacterized protein n=1 Tax=Elysia crispata TaxID=231223 RepID=A0AAE1DLB8_9GAST|nr:hypothetical protein RRG08_007245 [Elysia crispata]